MSVRDNLLVVPTKVTPMIRYNSTNPDTIQQAGNRIVAAAEFDATQVELPRTGPRQ